ncbi:MAG: hypothetical protein V4492_06690 [Chlamydiota bacterium]
MTMAIAKTLSNLTRMAAPLACEIHTKCPTSEHNEWHIPSGLLREPHQYAGFVPYFFTPGKTHQLVMCFGLMPGSSTPQLVPFGGTSIGSDSPLATAAKEGSVTSRGIFGNHDELTASLKWSRHVRLITEEICPDTPFPFPSMMSAHTHYYFFMRISSRDLKQSGIKELHHANPNGEKCRDIAIIPYNTLHKSPCVYQSISTNLRCSAELSEPLRDFVGSYAMAQLATQIKMDHNDGPKLRVITPEKA